MTKFPEIFKTIREFPNYEVTNRGRVISKSRRVKSKRGSYVIPERELSKVLDSYGYPVVRLYKNATSKCLKIHRLVMETFVGSNNKDVDHIDCDKENNNLSNLRYISKQLHGFIEHGSDDKKRDNKGRFIQE